MFLENIIIVVSLLVLGVHTEENKKGPQLWSISAHPSHSALSNLKQRELIDIWSTSDGKTQVLIDEESVGRVTESLDSAQIGHSLIEKDVFNLVQQEREYRNERSKRKKRSVRAMDWTSYHTLQDIEGYIGWLRNTLGGKVSVTPVARSIENRTVYVVMVSNNIPGPKKKIWIEGGIHAREWISPAAATYLLHQVATNPEFEEILEGTDWYFVPVLNPDGYDYSFKGNSQRLWRKNRSKRGMLARIYDRCVGVDLNRNWDVEWGVGASTNPCSSVYQGPQPFSEPEVNGVRKAMSVIKPDVFITLHSYGQSMLYPWGYTVEKPQNWRDLHELADVFKRTVKMASNGKTEYVIGGSAETYGIASGATDDWAFVKLNVPYSYTLELRDKGKYGFQLPEALIFDTVNETTVGIYCMMSYLTDRGRCRKTPRERSDNHIRPGQETPPEPRSAGANSKIIFVENHN